MRNKFTSPYCTLIIIICCVLLLPIYKISAQENGIYELIDDNPLSKKVSTKKGSVNDRKEFYNFSQKLHTTFYYENNKLKNKYGDGLPLRLNLEDINSLNTINIGDSQFNEIQIITVTLKNENDLNQIFDISNMPGFSKLKYIFIKCNFNCDAMKIRNFIKKSDQKIRIFYSSEKPS